jgi:hypothetical protein
MTGDTQHPTEGDTLVLTGTVYNRPICGLPLPAGTEFANSDQTFDQLTVDVIEVETYLNSERITLELPSGETAHVTYRGKSAVVPSGNPLSCSNSQGAEQAYTWEKVE